MMAERVRTMTTVVATKVVEGMEVEVARGWRDVIINLFVWGRR